MYVLAYIVTDLVNFGLLNRDEASLVRLVQQLALSQSPKGSFFSRRSPRQVDFQGGLKQSIHWSASSGPSNQPDYPLYMRLSDSLALQS